MNVSVLVRGWGWARWSVGSSDSPPKALVDAALLYQGDRLRLDGGNAGFNSGPK